MKRLVSYIYKYSEGVKGENIGVGKIDVNKDTLKINITLGFDKEIKNLKVCFFVKQDETTKLINIGNMNKTDIDKTNNTILNIIPSVTLLPTISAIANAVE